MQDGILTQQEENNLRDFRDRMANQDLPGIITGSATLDRASADRISTQAGRAALATGDGGAALQELDNTLRRTSTSMSNTDRRQLLVRAWETAVEKTLEDGLLTLDEESALHEYLDHFGLTQEDLNANRARPPSSRPRSSGRSPRNHPPSPEHPGQSALQPDEVRAARPGPTRRRRRDHRHPTRQAGSGRIKGKMIINNFDDILQAMEQDPALREAMRRHILTEELLQLPVQVSRLETSVAQLQEGQSRLETRMDNLEAGQEDIKGRIDNLEDGQKRLETGQSRLETGQEELKGRMDTMAGRLGDIIGSDYEARSLRVAPRRLQRLGIRNATLILAARQTPLQDILPVLEQAITGGWISEAEAEDLDNLDLAFTGLDPSGNTIQAAIETSITISPADTRRAARRAEILERATGTPTRAVIIGENISPEDQAEAVNLGVAFLQMQAHRE